MMKQQQLSKRNHYKMNKIQLLPISMTQSLAASPDIDETVKMVSGGSTDPGRLTEKKSSQADSLPESEG